MQSLSSVHDFIVHIPADAPVPQTASPPPVYEQSLSVLQVGWHLEPILVLQISPLWQSVVAVLGVQSTGTVCDGSEPEVPGQENMYTLLAESVVEHVPCGIWDVSVLQPASE